MGRSNAKRAIHLIRPPNEEGVGVFCITQKRNFSFYTFREIPCEIGGRGFALHRLGIGDLYHVRIGAPHECSCECLGYLRHGHCKHVLGLMALANQDLV